MAANVAPRFRFSTATCAAFSIKTVALEFLLHFIGDPHRPLHAADNHYHGGNAVSETYSYRDGAKIRKRPATCIVHREKMTVSRLGSWPELIASSLIAAMPKRFTGKWRESDPAVWAAQSFEVARRRAYRLPRAEDGQPAIISMSYASTANSAARRQLQLAGYRSATLLNASLTDR